MIRGKVYFFVLLYVATAQAIIGQLSCFDEIFGCGVGVFGNTEGERCICLENYPETDSLIILAHCANQEALGSPAICCPCPDEFTLLSDGDDYLGCIKTSSRNLLTARFEETRQFIRDSFEACNGHLRDDCAPNFNETLRDMVDLVDEVNYAIRVDCGNIKALSCPSESSSGSSSH